VNAVWRNGGHSPANDFIGRPAKHAFGGRVPAGDEALAVAGIYGKRRALDHRVQLLIGFFQLCGTFVYALLQVSVGSRQVLFYLLAFGDVLADPDGAALTVLASQCFGEMSAPQRRAVFAHVAPFNIHQTARHQCGGNGPSEGFIVIGVTEKHLAFAPDQCSMRPSIDGLHTGVAVHDHTVLGEQNANRCVFQNGVLFQQQVLQFCFGAASLPHVLNDPDRAFCGVLGVDGLGAHMAVDDAAVFAAHGQFVVQQLPG